MNEIFKVNDTVRSPAGVVYRILKVLGSGGQGEVYRVRDNAGAEWALKWYFPHTATEWQRNNIDELMRIGTPDTNFLWPSDMVYTDAPGQSKSFGYVMGLRPPEYKGLNDYVAGKVKPSAISLVTLGIQLSKAFRALHTKGLCYQDISFGNAFFLPGTGDVLICDNDNVTTNRSQAGGVLGTADFMAPEVVRGEARPSRDTDYHSLAVLLFNILFLGHPLCGRKILAIRCWDAPAREQLYGKAPVFIFDPSDKSNEAVEGDPEGGGNAIIRWNMYPGKIKATFIKAFTVGLGDPHKRITELEWLEQFSSLRDSRFLCNSCGSPNYHDAEDAKASGGKLNPCWHCRSIPKLPYRIRVGKAVVMLNSDSKLYSHHLGGSYADIDFTKPLAEVSQHPSDPNIWGLKNLGTEKWTLAAQAGGLKDVEPGRSAPLAPGNKIDFGRGVVGEIMY